MSYAMHSHAPQSSPIDNHWVLLVSEGADKVPMLARAGDGLFLLAFRTGHTARKFVADSSLEGAELRMVVPQSARGVLDQVYGLGASGVLVDFDVGSQSYRAAVAFA